MFKKLLVLVVIGIMAGCATTSGKGETSLVTAGKSLLAARETVVTAAAATDVLCKLGTLDFATCSQAKGAYELAKPAYDTAVDAYLAMANGGDPAAFQSALARFRAIGDDIKRFAGGLK